MRDLSFDGLSLAFLKNLEKIRSNVQCIYCVCMVILYICVASDLEKIRCSPVT